jgi:hypothetical protein
MLENLRHFLENATTNNVTNLTVSIPPHELDSLAGQVVLDMLGRTIVLGLPLEPRSCTAKCELDNHALEITSRVGIALPRAGIYNIETQVMLQNSESALGVSVATAAISKRQKPDGWRQRLALAPVNFDDVLKRACDQFPESMRYVSESKLHQVGYELSGISFKISNPSIHLTVSGSPLKRE